MTRTASSLISDSMSMIGDTVSRLSKSFSTEKPDDIIPMSSIVPEKSQNNETVEPRKCPKTQINYHHRRSQSVTSFAKYQNSKSNLTAKLSNNSVKLRPKQPREDTFCHEVWTWGKGHRGQHGHGDMLDRLQPSAISEYFAPKKRD